MDMRDVKAVRKSLERENKTNTTLYRLLVETNDGTRSGQAVQELGTDGYSEADKLLGSLGQVSKFFERGEFVVEFRPYPPEFLRDRDGKRKRHAQTVKRITQKASHYINLDIEPLPIAPLDYWGYYTPINYVKGGVWEFNPAQAFLFQSIAQDRMCSAINFPGYYIAQMFKLLKGDSFDRWSASDKAQLVGKKIVNANFVDFALTNPQYIPAEWRDIGTIWCFGTIYVRSSNEHGFCVRGISWRGGTWAEYFIDLEGFSGKRNWILMMMR